MLTVQRRNALCVDWVARLEPSSFNRTGSAPGIITAEDELGESSLQRASDGAVVVLFDGLLYDRRELADALDVSPVLDDAGLILHAWSRWRSDLVHHIRGPFAVIVWDGEARRLIAARDPLGEQPLFFVEDGSGLLLSASIDALLACPGVSRALNRAAIADHLCQRWPDPAETFFEAVRRVRPGHVLVSTARGIAQQRYWEPISLDHPVEEVSAEALDDFDARFERAVERVMDHGATGILLSGGIDSVSVAAAATDIARRTHRPLPVALSVSFPPPSGEEPMQRAVASALGLAQDVVPFWGGVAQGSLLSENLRLTRSLPVLMQTPWAPPYEHLVKKAARRGLVTIMDGTGGDEGLTPSPLYMADTMRSGNLPALLRFMAAWRRSSSVQASWYWRGMLWSYGLRAVGVSLAERIAPRSLTRLRVRRTMQFAPGYVAPDPRLRADLARRQEQYFDAAPTTGPLHLREAVRRLDHSVESQGREERFERARRIGVRYVHPLCDPDVAALAHRMSPTLLSYNGRNKYPLRRRIAGRFPTLGFDRQKKLGAGGFFRSILAAEIPALVRRTPLRALDLLGIVNGRTAADMVDSALKDENTRALLPVWELLKLETWAEARLS
jgi:asparagine synthase (glutamine-hydrolysing)